MNSLRCSQLDLLGRELIEAYRHLGDTDIFCLRQTLDGPDEVVTCITKWPSIGDRVSCASRPNVTPFAPITTSPFSTNRPSNPVEEPTLWKAILAAYQFC